MMMKKAVHFLLSILPMGVMIWIQLLIAILVTLAISLGCTLGMGWIGSRSTELYQQVSQQVYTDYMLHILITAQVFTAVIFFIWFLVKCNRPNLAGFQVLKNKKAWLCMLAFCLSAYFVTFLFLQALEYLLPVQMLEYAENMELLMPETGGFLIVLSTLVLAPISEELVFRGVTLYYAQKISGSPSVRRRFLWANLLQAALFGLVHMNVIQGTYAFLLGLVLGYLCYVFGSIWIPMAAHAVFNFMGTGAGGLLNWLPINEITYTAAALLAVALFLYGFSVSKSRRWL